MEIWYPDRRYTQIANFQIFVFYKDQSRSYILSINIYRFLVNYLLQGLKSYILDLGESKLYPNVMWQLIIHKLTPMNTYTHPIPVDAIEKAL